MAILIGVIALAVIPNIQRSRESKDLTTLDNILSATNIAIANLKVTGSGGDEYKSGSTDTVVKAVYEEIGAATLGSGAANGCKIYITYNIPTSGTAAAQITVKAATSQSANAATCKYTKNDSNTDQSLEVSNGSASSTSGSGSTGGTGTDPA